ncbi:HAD family hydrolase [Saccharopolyspora elongata]|uniref:HAD family hydrolase n=1 Tax=Saccharopolyspora elongata TaxID=2530387 RepID=A0A4R4YCI5_9PSEU|nr:HAD-IC family P-type ATPase [Saccharopolyspora elongata]TDD40882.1 HAD family hydrolase [Saccharopolyspora elongata]
MGSAASDAAAGSHSLSAQDVVRSLHTDLQRGLTELEAGHRLERYGQNVLPRAESAGPVIRLLRQLNHPLIYVLLVAGAGALVFGEGVDASVIFGVVLVNMLVGFVQESKAEAALDKLQAMVRTAARVLRDGRERTVPSDNVVPGDVVLVDAGDKVPADLRLIRPTNLRVDESALTGESVPVLKEAAELPTATPVADRRNMLYSGTLVATGAGLGIAVATGADTELGNIHRLVASAEELATPLTRKLAWFSKVLTAVILALAAVTFAIGVARGQGVGEMFTAAVALAVGAIPEGLPAAVTITLAIGVGRMARRRAVIRRLPAVETLGSTTVIGSDKTGTLTENQMTVRAVWTPDGRFDATGSGYGADGEILDNSGQAGDAHIGALHWCLLAGAACNDAALVHRDGRPGVVGDPTEGALLVVARKAGLDLERDVAVALPRLAALPFSSERQYMATLHAVPGQDRRVLLAKGAVERLLTLCTKEMSADGSLRPVDRDAVLAAAENLARAGLRVLAMAMKRVCATEQFDGSSMSTPLVFTGLQAMFDPPRRDAAAAVRACHGAGVAVKMITGDHAATATAIAGDLGLLDDGGDVLTGSDLAELPAGELPGVVDRAAVFARVSPEQKLRLVEAFQASGHVVAMTGDGVNDAPALRRADIGVAMGRSGTDVAKDAADMVLTDDDFATIEAAVEEGRGVFDNLTKFIAWTLPTNMAEGFVILVAIVLGAALPILPTQILWINMTTAVALGLMLAFEPKEADSMQRPPRDPRKPLLTRPLVLRILLVSVLLVGGSWWLYSWELANGATLAEARTAAVNLFVAVELVYLFNCRSLTRPMWSIGVFSNRWILGGVAVQAAGQLAITYLPVFNGLFHTAPITADVWLRILGLALLAWLIVAADKRLRKRLI